jgi:hypothetical protein
MKKTYLSALLIGLTSTVAFSQSVQKSNLNQTFSTEQPNPAPTAFSPKALGTQVWLDDFSTPGNWTIDNDGQTGPTFGFNIDATSQSWWSAAGMTTTGNYAEVNNGNPTATPGTQVLDVEYTMTTGPLDVMALTLANAGASTSEVILQFKEFGAKFYDDQRVQISTDGTTFTTVRTNEAYSQLTSTGGAAYPNPATVTVNIAPYISGNPTNVYIRFSWTSQFPTSTNANAWVAYGWFIDDVALYTKPTNDLVAKNYFWGTQGLQYYRIPTTQVAPIEFSAIAVNDGATAQNDVTLNVAIPSASYVGTSAAGLTINPNAQDTADVTTTFDPAATVASYPTTWNITQTEVDDVPANNILAPFTIEVTANTYASDNNVASSTTSNGGLAYKLGALYDIWNDQDLYAIDVKLNTATVNGSIIRGVLYAVNYDDATGWEYIEVASSDYHDIVAADKVGFLTLELTSPYTVTNSQLTYMAAIETDGDGGASNDVVISCAQETDIQIGFQDENGDWYQGFTPKTNAPMIRMNFDQTLGMDENEMVSGVSVYPNPATENIAIDFNLANSSDVTIEVVDATGKVAIAKTLASQTAGQANVSFETSALNSGVYFVNISTEAGKATQKFIKK